MNTNLPAVYSAVSLSFVAPLFPSKGEEVTLSIAFSSAPDSVLLKYDSNTGLVFTAEMTQSGQFNGGLKYSATVSANLDETLFHYFFVFFKDGVSYYYSKAGITRYTPSILQRFSLITAQPPVDQPSTDQTASTTPVAKPTAVPKAPTVPLWVSSSTCYQIFPDRFCNGDPSVGAKEGQYEFDGGKVTTPQWTAVPKKWETSRCCDFYNGDLKGIEKKAAYLKALGIDAIYINPIFASESVHRYDTVDFFSIDPKLGGDPALASLVKTMHENGIRVILDISINHTGLNGVWLKKALEDPKSDEHDFYYFNPDGSVACWQDVKTLPQLRYSSSKLRDRMYRNENSVMKKYLKEPFNIDGWRLDVSPEVGRRGSEQLCQELWRDINLELRKVKNDLYLVGEDWDDSTLYLQGDIWNATMNYYGSGRPLRSWLGEKDRFLCQGDGHKPELDKPLTAEEICEYLKVAIDSVPGQTPYLQMNLIDSHDTPRLHNHSKIFNRDLHKGVQLALYMLPGMPCTYYGDEVLLDGTLESNEGARYPMEWREEKQDQDMLSFMRKIGEIRKDELFAWSGVMFRPLDEDAFAIIRVQDQKALVAVINRGEARKLSLDLALLPRQQGQVVLGEGTSELEGDRLTVEVKRQASLLISLMCYSQKLIGCAKS